MSRLLAPLLICAAASLVGCSIEEIDPLLSGVFPCEASDDCPSSQACMLQKCRIEPAPEVLVLAPEAEAAIPIQGMGDVSVVITIGGANLDLVDPGSDLDADFGKGTVVVLVDDEEVAVLSSGEIATGVTFEVMVPPVPGAHRIRAVGRTSDGFIYDNDEAEGRRLFWLDDGLPHVGMVDPFPGDVFPLEATGFDVTVAAINFAFDVPTPGATPGNEAKGHAHVHYDEVFPACTFEPICDNGYAGVLAPDGPATSVTSQVMLPASAAGPATLTSVLRKVNHLKYLYPDQDGVPIWEDITIARADIEPVASESGSSDGG